MHSMNMVSKRTLGNVTITMGINIDDSNFWIKR